MTSIKNISAASLAIQALPARKTVFSSHNSNRSAYPAPKRSLRSAPRIAIHGDAIQVRSHVLAPTLLQPSTILMLIAASNRMHSSAAEVQRQNDITRHFAERFAQRTHMPILMTSVDTSIEEENRRREEQERAEANADHATSTVTDVTIVPPIDPQVGSMMVETEFSVANKNRHVVASSAHPVESFGHSLSLHTLKLEISKNSSVELASGRSTTYHMLPIEDRSQISRPQDVAARIQNPTYGDDTIKNDNQPDHTDHRHEATLTNSSDKQRGLNVPTQRGKGSKTVLQSADNNRLSFNPFTQSDQSFANHTMQKDKLQSLDLPNTEVHEQMPFARAYLRDLIGLNAFKDTK